MARTRPPKKQTQATEQQGRPKDNEFRAQPVNENVARQAPTNVHGFPTSKEYVFIQKKFDELLSKKFNFLLLILNLPTLFIFSSRPVSTIALLKAVSNSFIKALYKDLLIISSLAFSL